MEAKCVALVRFILFVQLLLIIEVHLEDFNEKDFIDANHHRGCTYLHCEKDDVCVHRKFRCKEAPCPSMLYCAKSRTESLRGPASCDTVQCTSGYECMLKVRRCHWDEKCEQQIARCVPRKEYYEGPASCAGFKCPPGNYCILRESFCASPPCKLLRSCAKNKEIHIWFGKCRSLGCPSEFECFLRRPENNCSNPPCKHTPDCLTLRETEVADEHCRGWICPRTQTCSAEVVGLCVGNDCNIKRTCQEILVAATNDSSSFFSRRSLRNEDEVSRLDVKRFRNISQGNGTDGTKILHSWMNHLHSKTELDAIELWINNANGQKDFKQLQDWLRSIKDILGPSAYSEWLEAILSSRGEEFRKWLLASHEKLEKEEKDAIFPRQKRPHALTENPYSAHDTTAIFSAKELKRRIEEIDSLLKERNLTNIAEKLLVPNRILLPPHSASENGLLNNLRESNRSPFFNYLLKYPIYTGEPFTSLQSPKIENNHEQSYIVLPIRNIKELSNPQILNYSSDSRVQNAGETISQTAKLPEKGHNSSAVDEDMKKDVLSLWTKVIENFRKEPAKKEAYPIENSISLPERNMLMDKKQYFDDVPVDLLENLIKSVQYPSIEHAPKTFNKNPVEIYHQENLSKFPPNENHDRNSEWSATTHARHKEDTSKEENLKESIDEFSFHDDDKRNFTNNFPEPEVSILLDKLGEIKSNGQNNFHPELSLEQITDEDNDTMDLDLFFELNRENLLPYIKTLMEAMDQENDPLNENPALNLSGEESSVESSILNNHQLRTADKSSDDLKSSKIESSNSFTGNLLNNVRDAYNYGTRDEGESNSEFHPQNDVKQTSLNSEVQQQQNDWKTPKLIYANEKTTIRSFYNLPSYGTGDNGDLDLQGYHVQRKRNNEEEELASYHVEAHSKLTDEDKYPN